MVMQDLREKLRKFVDSPVVDHKDMCSVVFLLMGHGTKKGTGIRCKLGDTDVVSTKFVMEQVSRMKYMDGKPKMVFFQCCRGSRSPCLSLYLYSRTSLSSLFPSLSKCQ